MTKVKMDSPWANGVAVRVGDQVYYKDWNRRKLVEKTGKVVGWFDDGKMLELEVESLTYMKTPGPHKMSIPTLLVYYKV